MDLLNTTFDATKYANTLSGDMYKGYYIAFDVRSVHILRVQENLNDDYEYEEGSIMLEHEMIDYANDIIDFFEEEYQVKYTGDDRTFINAMMTRFGTKKVLQIIADYDAQNGYENYDYKTEYTTVQRMIDEYIIQDSTLSNISI